MNKELKAYANLVITMGIDLYPGQSLLIKTGPASYGFASLLAREAYRLGAGYVKIDVEDNRVLKARLDHLGADDEIKFPRHIPAVFDEMLSDDWAYIRIEETADTEVLRNADSSVLQRYTREMHTLQRKFKNAMMNNEHPWCVICAPSLPWARQVLGESATEQQLWEVLRPILRLDAPDPKAAWKEHGQRLLERSRRLTEMKLDSLHIQDEGTDLTIGLTEHAAWVGGPDQLADGRYVFVNIPSEEVFTVPDAYRTEGTVRLTMPVTIMETTVEGVSLTFRKGKVVDFTAEKNGQILEQFLTLDEGTSYLGEIALVDTASPIYQSGKLFNSVLYDENAACHIALGQGYSGCLDVDPPALTAEEKRAYHCNVSMEHSDVMISTGGTCVTGTDSDGNRVQIMDTGKLLV